MTRGFVRLLSARPIRDRTNTTAPQDTVGMPNSEIVDRETKIGVRSALSRQKNPGDVILRTNVAGQKATLAMLSVRDLNKLGTA